MNFLIHLQKLLKNLLKTKMNSDLQDDIPYVVDSLHGSPFNSQPEEEILPKNENVLTKENFMEYILKNNDFWDVIVKHSRAMLDIFVRQLIDGLSLTRIANIEQKDLIDFLMSTKELKTLNELKVGLDPNNPFIEEEEEDDEKVDKVPKKKKEPAPIPDGHQKCSTCNRVLPFDDFGNKPNGDKNKSCEKCRLKKKEYYEKQRQLKKEKKVVVEDIEKEDKLKIEKCPAPPPKKRKLATVEQDESLEEEDDSE